MKSKKQLILFSVLTALSISLIAISLFVPVVHLVGKDTALNVVYDKNVNLIQYIIDAPFLNTDAYDVYFSANGPIWLATASILFNFLVATGGLVMTALCIIEISTYKTQNLTIKNNVLAKKISLFVGSFSVFIGIFEITSFVVTNFLSNNYVLFNLSIEPFVLITLGIAIIILASKTKKREQIQKTSKLKNSLGFGLSGLFSLVGVLLLFIPQYSLDFGLGVTSLWDVGRSATKIASDTYILNTLGDYPFGFSTWVMFAIFLVTAFIFIYNLIGFIRALRGKSTSWLFARVKRWSMTYLIVYSILYLFVLCQSAVWWSTTVIIDAFGKYFSLLPYAYVLMIVPYLPYIFSTMISFENKKK